MNTRYLLPIALAGLAACNSDSDLSSGRTMTDVSDPMRVEAGIAIHDAQTTDITSTAPGGDSTANTAPDNTSSANIDPGSDPGSIPGTDPGSNANASNNNSDNSVASSADVGSSNEASTVNAATNTASASRLVDSTATSDNATSLSAVVTPVVRVSENQSVELFQTTQVTSDVQLFGFPMDGVPVLWESISGTGIATFDRPFSKVTDVSFDTVGQYVLRLTATHEGRSASDTLVVTVTPPPVAPVTNAAPVVTAGADQIVALEFTMPESTTAVQTVLFSGSVVDDGLPDGELNTTWQQFSGPAIATIENTTSATTTVRFDVAGNYIFELVANDTELVSRDRLQVTVNKPSSQPNATEAPVNASTINASRSAWRLLSNGGTEPDARHEAGAVALNGRIYLLGGRGKRAVNEYNPNTERWKNLGTPSQEMHHFQPVVYRNKIWVVGAMTCCFPREDVLPRIQVFDPATKKWSQGPRIPANRLRGSAGAVIYKGKLYVVGGTTNGHDGGDVKWFDVYDPETDSWNSLPDAPTSRDHASAIVVDDKLIFAGGRQTDHPRTFANLVKQTDVYDFKTGRWTKSANIPTPRAGATTVGFGDEVIVAGGETERAGAAEKTVQAYNSNTGRWRTLPSLKEGRHSGGAAVLDGIMHVISGNGTRGGGDEVSTHEVLDLN